MTPQQFRRLALALSGAVEGAHMGHADFRMNGKVLASLGHPGPGFGVVIVSPTDQAVLVAAQPEVFAPANGAWGARGCTVVTLAKARAPVVRDALQAAAERRPPRRPKGGGRRRRAA
jgi:hypothetical protein